MTHWGEQRVIYCAPAVQVHKTQLHPSVSEGLCPAKDRVMIDHNHTMPPAVVQGCCRIDCTRTGRIDVVDCSEVACDGRGPKVNRGLAAEEPGSGSSSSSGERGPHKPTCEADQHHDP